LTPPHIAALKLFTARAIIPGFQPIYFGYKERRLAVNRLYQLPHQLGLTASLATPQTLNCDPHPLS
ncbi:MAG: hypothetical protein KDJ52_08100, partial [Anaerolineae bacterium]|nr:hypothetical protein [Anaerolineae bacterium]